ncbi:hypothetical protein BJX96DRAFT_62912 [Aspergillus floccosus]
MMLGFTKRNVLLSGGVSPVPAPDIHSPPWTILRLPGVQIRRCIGPEVICRHPCRSGKCRIGEPMYLLSPPMTRHCMETRNICQDSRLTGLLIVLSTSRPRNIHQLCGVTQFVYFCVHAKKRCMSQCMTDNRFQCTIISLVQRQRACWKVYVVIVSPALGISKMIYSRRLCAYIDRSIYQDPRKLMMHKAVGFSISLRNMVE